MRTIMLVVPVLALITAKTGSDNVPPSVPPFHSGVGSEHGGDLAALAEPSNLVFVGRVVRVDYRLSRKTDEGAELPHAIVTYQITRVLRGQFPARTIILRFIGGSDGAGHFMEVSAVPKFQVGDEDLLFLAGNGESGCPLVMCEWGRYRILRGGVYNNHGYPVRAIRETHAIARGTPPKELLTLRYPAPTFDDLLKNPEARALIQRQRLPEADLRRRYSAEVPREIELVQVVTAPVGADTTSAVATGASAIATTPNPLPEGPMAIEEFISTLERILSRTARKPSSIRSIDPNAPIVVTRAAAREPQMPQGPRPGRVVPSAADQRELTAIQKQNFNPVIK